MRVFIKGLILGTMLTIAWSTGDTLFSSRMYLGEARIHTIQNGEQLSTLAQQYYGNAVYWRELALINRAPNANNIYPGEKILLPSVNAIDKLAQARRLSEVNDLVGLEEEVAVQETTHEAREFTTKQSAPPAQKTEPAPTQNTPETTIFEATHSETENGLKQEISKEKPSVSNLETAPKEEAEGALNTGGTTEQYEEPILREQQIDAGAYEQSSVVGIWFPLLIALGVIGLAYGLVSYRRKVKANDKNTFFEITPLKNTPELENKPPIEEAPKFNTNLPRSNLSKNLKHRALPVSHH
ncbi:MAG: LysM peptidoglycan-binding domain-containing protein [Deferribacteres bacterium]|nr:LysM peptidoglycan-binding domain-containing protein [candidate division KSB1 bacterium]MCB9500393.1 LysM peptidoglycan-binding domain-containing protein [Deferribacteres bacterium]